MIDDVGRVFARFYVHCEVFYASAGTSPVCLQPVRAHL